MKMVVLSLGYLHKTEDKEEEKLQQKHTVHIAIAPNFEWDFVSTFSTFYFTSNVAKA